VAVFGVPNITEFFFHFNPNGLREGKMMLRVGHIAKIEALVHCQRQWDEMNELNVMNELNGMNIGVSFPCCQPSLRTEFERNECRKRKKMKGLLQTMQLCTG
jgi:hypothetical protein